MKINNNIDNNDEDDFIIINKYKNKNNMIIF